MPRVLNKKTATALELSGAVYVGRPSRWGNPFRVDHRSMTRDMAILKFRHHLDLNPQLVMAIKRHLRGKDLVCWCAPAACHADVLLEVANG